MVLGLVVLYALFFSAYTIQRHNAFLTSAFDLGNFDQAVWNTAQGRPLALTNIPEVTNRLAHHVEPILLLIAPLYWLWSDVRILLILQSVAIGAGAIPLFWYASRHVGAAPALIFALCYLLFPALEGVNLFDFHAVALAPFFLLLAWNWLDEQRDGPFLVAGLLAAMTKEEISLLVAMMGLYALVIQRRRFGWLPFVTGVGWFLFVLEVISPTFNQSGKHEFIGFYGQWGEGALEIVFNWLTHPLAVLEWLSAPERVGYLQNLLTPTVGLSLLAPQVLLIAAPSLAVNLLSSYPPMTTLEGFHYPAPIVPFVIVSAVAALSWCANWGSQKLVKQKKQHTPKSPLKRGVPSDSPLERGFRGVLSWPFCQVPPQFLKSVILWGGTLAILFSSLSYHYDHGATPLAAAWQWPTVTEHHRLGEEIIRAIPREVAVSAQSQINPHLSQREKIYRFPDVRDAELIMIDVTAISLFFHPNDLLYDMQERLASGVWGIDTARDGWLLLERCEGQSDCKSTLPDEFYSYARAANRPQYGIDAQFGDLLRLAGYEIKQGAKGTEARFYWQALRPITEPIRLWPLFYDADWERVLEDTSLRPLMETVWYPPQMWATGEVVQTTTLPWPIGPDWNLAIAVLEGDNPASPRLPITLKDGTAVPEFPQEGLMALLKVRDGEVLADSLRRFSAPESLDAIEASLSDGIRLVRRGYTSQIKPNETLAVTLGWQAGEKPPSADYTAFVQLLGPTGLVAQSDAYPTTLSEERALTRPTTGWAAHEVILDHHTLAIPATLPAGNYQLITGLYDLSKEGTRLPATLNGVPLPDGAIPLGEVVIGD